MADKEHSRAIAERYKEIVSVLTRNGLGFLFVRAALSPNPTKTIEKLSTDTTGPTVGQRLVKAFEELGPAFVKIGQILSTRSDMIPPSIAADLSALQDHVSEFAFEDARAEIEEQLQDTIENCFENFNPKPIAAASISQVYSAYLHSGQHVAVKVQRPHIAESVKLDMEVLTQLATFVDKHTKYGALYNFSGMVAELQSAMEKEIDFTIEAQNVDRFRQQVSKQAHITAPKIIWIYTTPKVLTMDFVDGIKINDIEALNAMHADKSALAHAYVDSLIDQILVYGFFHADPHPGNVMVVDAGFTIEFIDLGMVGELTPRFRQQLASFVLGLATQNMQKIAQSLMSMDLGSANVNQYHFTKELSVVLDKYLYGPMQDVSIADVFSNIFEMAAKYKMKVPRQITLVGKCLGTAQTTISLLDPSLSILEIAQETAQTLIFAHLRSDDFRQNMLATALDMVDLAKTTPRVLLSALRKAEDNDFALELKVDHLQELGDQLEHVSNRISFTVILLSVCLLMAAVIIAIAYASPSLSGALSGLDLGALILGGVIAMAIVLGIILSMMLTGRKKRKRDQ